MRSFSLLAALLVALLIAAGCGGGSSGTSAPTTVPKGDVAVVGSREVTVKQLDTQVSQKLRAAKIAKQKVPKPGTDTYQQQVVQPVVDALVFDAQLENIADQLGVSASDKEVDSRLKANIKQYYGGDQSKFQADLKRYHVSEDAVRQQLRLVILQEKLQKKLLAEVKVTDADVRKYYDAHKSDYASKDTRQVRFILVDGKARAKNLRDQLMHGGSWKTIAKKYSNDPGSAAQGGKFTVQRGTVVPQFESAAFGLPVGEFSQPIQAPQSYVGQACKTTCYFVIEPTAATKKGKQQPFDKVKAQIKQTLESQRKQAHLQSRAKALFAAQKKITRYATPYQPQGTTGSAASTSSGGGSAGG